MLRNALAKSFAAVPRQAISSWVGPLTHQRGASLERGLPGVSAQTLAGNAGSLTRTPPENVTQTLTGNAESGTRTLPEKDMHNVAMNGGLVTRTLATLSCDRLLRTGGWDISGDLGVHAFTTSAAAQQQQPYEESLEDKRNPPGSPLAGEDMQVDAMAAEQGKSKKLGGGFVAPHPGLELSTPGEDTAEKIDYMLHHPVYDKEYLESVKPVEYPATEVYEKVGYAMCKTLRTVFDTATGYGKDMTEAKFLRRFIYLETIAGVPGMVGGMLRHMRSLRTMNRDHGWIHTLLEEAENERMHLLTFLQLRKPGPLMRAMVLLGQGVFFNFYLVMYLISPRMMHAFVDNLEREAVKTYTHAIHDIDQGHLPYWAILDAPAIAKDYWRLPEGSKMRDVILAIRADEACHAHVNHVFSKLGPEDENPFDKGSHLVP